jgi:hypothetical protein
MAVSRKLLTSGEHEVFSVHTHVKALFVPALVLLLTSLAGGYAWGAKPPGERALGYVIAGLALVVILTWCVAPFPALADDHLLGHQPAADRADRGVHTFRSGDPAQPRQRRVVREEPERPAAGLRDPRRPRRRTSSRACDCTTCRESRRCIAA